MNLVFHDQPDYITPEEYEAYMRKVFREKSHETLLPVGKLVLKRVLLVRADKNIYEAVRLLFNYGFRGLELRLTWRDLGF